MDLAELDKYLGMHIREICGVGFDGDNENHCAHFVSHVLGFRFGATCRMMVHGSGTPASIRVQEIFPRCPAVGRWEDLPAGASTGLVFITNERSVNLSTKSMMNVPRKHVGIFSGPRREIWHYSNSRDQVVRQTPAQFSRHYPAPHNVMFWGTLPVVSGS